MFPRLAPLVKRSVGHRRAPNMIVAVAHLPSGAMIERQDGPTISLPLRSCPQWLLVWRAVYSELVLRWPPGK